MQRAISGGFFVWMVSAAIVPAPQGSAAQLSLPPVATMQARPIMRVQSAQAAPASAEPTREPSTPIERLVAAADPAAGEAYARKVCAACHSLNEGGKAIIGPNLYGVVGGPHAHMAGFNYSDALKSKQGPWTYDELYAWLTRPADYAPGTRMAFPGIKDPKVRVDVIAYLRTLSHAPEPLPDTRAGSQ